jgi:hypothetical protein
MYLHSTNMFCKDAIKLTLSNIKVNLMSRAHKTRSVTHREQQTHQLILCGNNVWDRSQWPRGLRRRSAAARLLRSWVWIPPIAWMFICFECCVLSGRGLCNDLITRPEESYRLCCVVVCDLETLWMRRPWPTGGYCARNKKNKRMPYLKIWMTPLCTKL